MAYSGSVIRWHDRGGYGFVKCDDYEEDLFVHHSSFGGGDLIAGKTLTFDVEDDPRQGKKRCVNVKGPAVDASGGDRRGGGGGGGMRKRDSRDRGDRYDRDRGDRYDGDSRDRRGGGRRDREDSRDRRRRDSRDRDRGGGGGGGRRYDSRDRDRRR